MQPPNENTSKRGSAGLHKAMLRQIIELCTIIGGGEDYNDTEAFGREREEFLRKFLELPTGIPDSDTFRHLFERLDPTELSVCLYDQSGFHA